MASRSGFKFVHKGLPPVLASKSTRFLARLRKDCLIRGEEWEFDWPQKSAGSFPPKPKRQHKRVLNREARLKKIEAGLALQPQKMEEYKKFLDSRRSVPLQDQHPADQLLDELHFKDQLDKVISSAAESHRRKK